MRSPMISTLLSVVLLASVGCDEGEGETPTSTRAAALDDASPEPERRPSYAPATLSDAATRAAAPIDAVAPTPAPSQPPATIAGQPWRTWVSAELERLATEEPQWLAEVTSLEPKRTRAGFMRLIGPQLESPSAAPVLLHRYLELAEAGGSPQLRAAVVEALARTGGEYAAAVTELLASEADASVRVAMMASLRRASGPDALAGLALGLADADAEVRLAAASAIGHHGDGAQLGETLIAALANDDAVEVQRAAARALGYLGVESAAPSLAAKLDSPDAGLRLAALQAIDRVDPSYAAGLAELELLLADEDAKVARAAARVAER